MARLCLMRMQVSSAVNLHVNNGSTTNRSASNLESGVSSTFGGVQMEYDGTLSAVV